MLKKIDFLGSQHEEENLQVLSLLRVLEKSDEIKLDLYPYYPVLEEITVLPRIHTNEGDNVTGVEDILSFTYDLIQKSPIKLLLFVTDAEKNSDDSMAIEEITRSKIPISIYWVCDLKTPTLVFRKSPEKAGLWFYGLDSIQRFIKSLRETPKN